MLSEFSFQFWSFLIVITITRDDLAYIHNAESFTLKKTITEVYFQSRFYVGNLFGESFHMNNSEPVAHMQSMSPEPEPSNSRLL